MRPLAVRQAISAAHRKRNAAIRAEFQKSFYALPEIEQTKVCWKCGRSLPLNAYHKKRYDLTFCVQTYCKDCARKNFVAFKNKRLLNNPKLEWAKQAVAAAKYRSKNKSYGVTITPGYLASIAPNFCPVFGFELRYPKALFVHKKGGDFDSASVDRINPLKGYDPDNVVVISRKANVTKNNCSVKELRRVADWLEHEEIKRGAV